MSRTLTSEGGSPHRFPLSFQLALPADFRKDCGFHESLEVLRELGFIGVELNIANPFSLDWDLLRSFLSGHGLAFTRFASGLTAKTLGLSLSADDEEHRMRSVDACRRIIGILSGREIGFIIGFMKGAVVPDARRARDLFSASLAELYPEAEAKRVSLVIEATNRRETSVANTLDDAASLCSALPRNALGETVEILPDTYHMNIEEADVLDALRRHVRDFKWIHFSDDNRLLPGLGALPFGPIVRTLTDCGFAGGIALEGTSKGSFTEDIRASLCYLGPLLA